MALSHQPEQQEQQHQHGVNTTNGFDDSVSTTMNDPSRFHRRRKQRQFCHSSAVSPYSIALTLLELRSIMILIVSTAAVVIMSNIDAPIIMTRIPVVVDAAATFVVKSTNSKNYKRASCFRRCDNFFGTVGRNSAIVRSISTPINGKEHGAIATRIGWREPISIVRLYMAQSSSSTESQPNFQSNDPYVVLGIRRGTGATYVDNRKEIKRAYKRLALQYHPDMVTTKDSTSEQKKVASDRFSKINWAYTTLMNGNKSSTSTTATTTTSAGTSGKSTASEGWVPPHRRTGSYASSSRGSSSTTTDPFNDDNYYNPDRTYADNEAQYDAGGDSFTKIFSDLFAAGAGVASGVGGVGTSGIFSDFVEFLEKNVDGYSSNGGSGGSRADETELRILLQTGSFDEIADEMDDTDLIVQQLQTKRNTIENDIIMITADVKLATRYREKMELQERLDELNARKEIVNNYIQKARQRLLKLQSRYKELIVQGASGSTRSQSTTTTAPSWDDLKREYGSSSSRSSGSSGGSSSTSTSRSSQEGTASSSRGSSRDGTTESDARSASNDDDDSWKAESFGSFGRGSSNRRNRQRRSSTTSSGYEQQEPPPPPPRQPSSTSSQPYSGDSGTVPPHRRTVSFEFDDYKRKEEDKRRLREIKVDEEFDKLKKELGLK